ncbi:hypothetical protein [Trabulsiella odontotermitis]|uniref:hypothetical protein n=1 Tax=Trabulsiella odontotermitis TaxID=379893 RepID=UPI0006767AAB|nr:hypothetical protein [Trabulsiella odontotermitis]
MRKSAIPIAMAMALASLNVSSVTWDRAMSATRSQSYPIASNRHTGKAEERRAAKRRRRAK